MMTKKKKIINKKDAKIRILKEIDMYQIHFMPQHSKDILDSIHGKIEREDGDLSWPKLDQ